MPKMVYWLMGIMLQKLWWWEQEKVIFSKMFYLKQGITNNRKSGPLNAYTLTNLQIIENVLILSLRMKPAAIYNHVQLINIQTGRHVRLVAVLDKNTNSNL